MRPPPLVALGLALLAQMSLARQPLERVDDLTLIDPETAELVRLDPGEAAARRAAGAAAVRAPAAPPGATGLDEGYLACFSSDTANPFDLTSYALAPPYSVAPEGRYPYDAAVSPDEAEVWHVGASGDHVLVIDRATNTITQRIPVGLYPVGIAFSWDGALVFVSSRDDRRLDVIDRAAYQVIRSLPWPGLPSEEPGKIAVDPVSRLVYVAEWYGPRVYELDADATSILRTISPGDSHWMIVVSPDGRHLYVAERDPQLKLIRDIDRESFTELRTIAVCQDPWGLDRTQDGKKLVVCCRDADEVQVVDVASGTALPIPLPTSLGPEDLDIHDASGRAFVAGGREGPPGSQTAVLYVVDIATASIARRVEVPCYKASVVAVQGKAEPPACPATLPAVAPIFGTKLPGTPPADLRFEWSSLRAGEEGYNTWRVARRAELPIVTNPPAAGVTSVCSAGPDPHCDEAGAVAGPRNTTWYYEVRAMCGSLEGP